MTADDYLIRGTKIVGKNGPHYLMWLQNEIDPANVVTNLGHLSDVVNKPLAEASIHHQRHQRKDRDQPEARLRLPAPR